MVVRCKETDTEAICMFWVGVWGGGGYVLVGFLVLFFFPGKFTLFKYPYSTRF